MSPARGARPGAGNSVESTEVELPRETPESGREPPGPQPRGGAGRSGLRAPRPAWRPALLGRRVEARGPQVTIWSSEEQEDLGARGRGTL